ncbi:MAG: tetratricopeptide repeat protein [Chthoniobacteraceae bacterium]
MHEQPKRQLFSACRGPLLLLAGAGISFAQAGAADAGKLEAPAEQIRSVRIAEAAIFAGMGASGKDEPTQEDLNKIARLYKQIVVQYPKSADAWNAEGEYEWRIENHPDAMVEWMTAEKLDSNNSAVAGHLAACYLELGYAKKATEYFEKAAKLDPKNALFQFNAGNSSFLFRHELTNSTDNEQAVILRSFIHFQMASQLEPFNIDYAQAYAQAFYSLLPPDWNKALEAWSHYLQITDEKDFAYSNLARVNLKLGHKQEARENLAKIGNEKFAALKKHMLLQINAPD